jgi:hypothetical protein
MEFLGISRQVWMVGGGIVLLGASLLIVNRFGLQSRGMMAPLRNGQSRLPALAAIVLGLAGGALLFLGTRSP